MTGLNNQMKHRKILGTFTLGALLLAPLAVLLAAENSWSGHRFAPDEVKEIDLASDTAWTLSVDDGTPRKIKVPGGGYNSDRQDQPWIQMDVELPGKNAMPQVRAVKDHATYQREISIPKEAEGKSVALELGAVNHGAEVFLIDGGNETLVGEHAGPLMPFSVDLTRRVQPGRTYGLKVKTYPLWHYGNKVPVGFIYSEGWVDRPSGYASKFGFGITSFIRLAIYPQVRIRDIFVRPSVSRSSLSCDVWLRNDTDKDAEVEFDAGLDSWNGDRWNYPTLPTVKATIPAKSEKKVTLGPVPWTLGQASFWWPNKPFNEGYQAKLHNLKLTLRSGDSVSDRRTQRFGFVEWTEGPFYYLVNGVRINFISDGTPEAAMSEYDCYSSSPAFLPPDVKSGGCPESWRRYMRMGICANRIHQSTPTQYMMDVADELGFMLIPETAIRGCQGQVWDDAYLPQAVRELAKVCRNHPSVCRYSLQNEATVAWAGPLGDAIFEEDNTRPLVFEDDRQRKPCLVAGREGSHAYAMIHYANHPKPAQMISGVGEHAWGGDQQMTMQTFANLAADGRRWDCAYFAGWDWINYWPNFLEGMSAARHVWKQSYFGKDRQDGEDGWNSPVVRWVQQRFHPYLVMDADFAETNGPFSEGWPKRMPTYHPGETVSRSLAVFNDGLDDAAPIVRWSAHWDSPDGEQVAQGELPGPAISAGFHAMRELSITVPSASAQRTLFLVLESVKNGKVVFHDEQVRFLIDPAIKTSSAKFLSDNTKIQGNWPGQFGALGREIVGNTSDAGAALHLSWDEGKEFIYSTDSSDVRALCVDPAGGKTRIAAARYGSTVKFIVDVGSAPMKVSLYMLDWDTHARRQEIVVSNEGNRIQDRRMVADFHKGIWLSWTVTGRVSFILNCTTGSNAVVSGIFLDR